MGVLLIGLLTWFSPLLNRWPRAARRWTRPARRSRGERPGRPAGAGAPSARPRSASLSDLPGVASFAVMGTTIAGCLGVFVWLGLWADPTWHTSPWGLLFGIVLGTVAAVVSVVKLVRRFL